MLKIIILVIASFISLELKQVIHLFRHGKRTPKHGIYKIPAFKGKAGELTTVGKLQHLILGSMLYKKYKFLLESKEDLLFLTSSTDRCKNSWKYEMYNLYNNKPQFENYRYEFTAVMRSNIASLKYEESLTYNNIKNNNINIPQFENYETEITNLKIENYKNLNIDQIKFKYNNYDKKILERDDLFKTKHCKNKHNSKYEYKHEDNEIYKIILDKFTSYFNKKYKKFNIKENLEKNNLLTILDDIISIYYFDKNIDLFEGVTDQDIKMMNDFVLLSNNLFFTKNKDYLKLKAHNLIRFWKKNIKYEDNNKENLSKFIFLSGHNQNLESFLFILLNKDKDYSACLINQFKIIHGNKLNINNIQNDLECSYTTKFASINKTRFASSIQLEISNNNKNEYFINVIYDGKAIFSNTVKKFIKIFEEYDISNNNYKKLCGYKYKKLFRP